MAAGQDVDASAETQAAADAAQVALASRRAEELQRAQMEKYRAQVQAAYQAVKQGKRKEQ